MGSLRILHTSDWHLGHQLHGHDRTEEHQAFLRWLEDQVVQWEADALLVAGDIYQTSSPSALAEQTFYDFIGRMRQRAPKTQLVIVGGNHDSAARLEAARAFYRAIGVSVVGALGLEESPDRAVVCIEGSNGRGWVAAVPFLRPSDLSPDIVRDGGAAAGVHARYASVTERVDARRAEDEPLIVMGHGHMVGGQISDGSERALIRGDEEALPTSVFGEFSYAALGHLHLAQEVEGASAPVRYSGSPIPLSMAEAPYPHQVLRVDFEGAHVQSVAELRVPRLVDLIRFQVESPEPLAPTLEALRGRDFGEHPTNLQPYLEVGVFLEEPTPDLHDQIRAALDGKDVRLIKITPKRAAAMETRLGDTVVDRDLGDLNPEDVLIEMHRVHHDSLPSDALLRAFRELRLEVEAG